MEFCGGFYFVCMLGVWGVGDVFLLMVCVVKYVCGIVVGGYVWCVVCLVYGVWGFRVKL